MICKPSHISTLDVTLPNNHLFLSPLSLYQKSYMTLRQTIYETAYMYHCTRSCSHGEMQDYKKLSRFYSLTKNARLEKTKFHSRPCSPK
jgi:hypothetical protein